MKLKTLWLIPSLLICALAFADDHGSRDSGVLKKTAAGRFYSSQETIDQGFPFSDVVVVSGELVFLSGLVGTDLEGELVDGGLVPESHAIFRQMQNHLDQMGLDLDDVVKCLVMIDNIDEWADFNKIYTSYFKPPYPARSAFGADGLALGAALELECTAVKR
ncbi:MAG: RidA family protein [Pseudomonadales bacterium]|nr:RidA family protein [Pseudomonadales bacterium]